MAQFDSGTPATFTPVASTTQINSWVLTVLTAGQMANVKMISWGGDGTSLVGYITRWGRVTNTPATPTALLIASGAPLVTPTATCNQYATQATGVADNSLFKINWNVQGGGGVVVLPIGGEWTCIGGALGQTYNQIGCGNVTGSDANLSSYAVQWQE